MRPQSQSILPPPVGRVMRKGKAPPFVETVMPFPVGREKAKGCVSAACAVVPVVSSGGWRMMHPRFCGDFCRGFVLALP